MTGILLGDRYELLEKIGEGGMSVVYKAKDKKLNRFIAVKILKKELINDLDIVDKFKREATAIANLNDPNIVSVLDVGSQEIYNYIVMEYVKGKTLKDLIREKGRLSYDISLSIAIQVAKALDCAHKNNIIHRDIKPQNILVAEGEVIKVTDFGIAKSTNSSTITNTANVMGSAHYFSPEQAKGNYIDCRTDLYSLGVVIYEMVTGRVPFDADSPVSVALKHIQEEVVPPKNINSAVPESLNKLILKSMEKEQIKRYQSSKELIVDLEKIQKDPNVLIGSIPVSENEFTKVMAPVSVEALREEKVNSLRKDDNWDDDDDEDYWDDEPRRNGKKKNVKAGIILGLLAVLILIGAALTTYFVTTKKVKVEDIKMPKIIGLSQDDAKKTLDNLGLDMLVAGQEKSTEPEGTIVKSNKNEGDSVKKGETIRVYVSGGETKKTLQDLTGLDENRAKAFLTNSGIKIGSISKENSDTVQEGMVIKQIPEAGTEIGESDKVDLVISNGPKTVAVPKLLGLTKDAAMDALNKATLKGDSKDKETSNKNEDGKVLEVSVQEGTHIQQGAKVSIYVGKYIEPEIEFGDLIGKPISEARNFLQSQKINVNVKGTGTKVQSMNKTKAVAGDTVTITTDAPQSTTKTEDVSPATR